jgi:hypothetical protein
MKTWPLGKYGLAWVLLALFLVSWVLQTWTGWREFESEQQEHQQTAQVFGDDGYIWNWARATTENWQSEFFQVLAFVALTSFLVFKGSPESRDGDDEMKAMLERIERRLDAMEPTGVGSNSAPAPTDRSARVSLGVTGD